MDPALSPAARASAGAGFDNTLRSNPGAIIHVSAADESLTFSNEAASLLGLSHGHTVLAARQLPAPLLAAARQGLAGCAVNSRQIQFSFQGKDLSVVLTMVPLMVGPKIQAALLLLNDLAGERELERHLHQVNRLANAGTLAASMAHEIKNGLVAGKTFVDLLLEKNRQDELADLVRRELGRIDNIVGRLLRLAGPGEEVTVFEPVHLHEIIEYAARLVAPELERKGIQLERSLEASPDLVSGEASQLQQAALNLLLNAMEALSAGGKISIRTHMHDGSPLAGRGQEICLKVLDDGPGISPEHLAHVFEPFFTTKPTGTGLGLAITRRIITEHGGGIAVKSQPGQGTCFDVLLPIAALARP